LQNKILQGMAMKIPTVTHRAGAKGIDTENNEVLMISEGKEEMARHILLLLENEVKRKELAEKAYTYIYANFLWKIQNEKLMNIFQ